MYYLQMMQKMNEEARQLLIRVGEDDAAQKKLNEYGKLTFEEINRMCIAHQILQVQLIRTKAIAIAIKIVVAAGGLVMIAGANPTITRIFGILVATAATYDAIFLNHKKLLAVDEAATAYRLFHEANNFHFQTELAGFVNQFQSLSSPPFTNDKNLKSNEARDGVIKLFERTRKKYFDTRMQIEKALSDVNRDALRALSVEAAKAAIPGASATSTS
jgi:hypothetical protein